MMNPSGRYNHVATVMRIPSAKMPAPRRRYFCTREKPARCVADRAWLTTSEIPTMNRKSDAVAIAKYRQNPVAISTGKIAKK